MYPLENFLRALQLFLATPESVTGILLYAYEAVQIKATPPYLCFDGDEGSWYIVLPSTPTEEHLLVVEIPLLIERHYRFIVEEHRKLETLLDMVALYQQFEALIRKAYAKTHDRDSATSCVR